MLRRIGIVVVTLVVARLLAAFIWPTINDVRTGATPQYPDLQPQRFAQPYDRVFDAALTTARAQGWDVTTNDRDRGHIEAVSTTRLFRFKDDVTIDVTRDGDSAVVNVRSHSRIGKGDFGTNARRIRRFQAEIAQRL
jgi:uncharacterized protein (DUF1499 family)